MEISGIIKSDLINHESDSFWNSIDHLIQGKSQRGTLILIRQAESGNVQEGTLGKMIDACKLNAADYHLLSLEPNQSVAWHQLKEKLAPKIIFLVGILPSQLGISALFRLNEPNKFDDSIWLPTLSVGDLDQHAEAKKQLWVNGMKPIFVDKIYNK